MKKLILLIAITITLSSCFPAYKIQPKADRTYKLADTYTKPVVSVLNSDSLKREFKILKRSQLYTFTNDSTSAIKIKLYHLQKNNWFCGNTMILSTVTLGVLPSENPYSYTYAFDEIKNGSVVKKEVELNVSQNLWLLNLFSNKKNFKKQAGIALRAKLGQ